MMNRSIRQIAGELVAAKPMPSMYAEDWPDRPRAESVAKQMEGARLWLKRVARKLLSISARQWISAYAPPNTSRVVLLEWEDGGHYYLVLARYAGDWIRYSLAGPHSGSSFPEHYKPIRWREIDWENDPRHPKEWTHNARGEPTCTAFERRDDDTT